MLRFIVHAEHRLTLLPYLEHWAGDLAARIEIISYDELFRSKRLPLCTHVFTDFDRLTPEDRENAAFFWNALAGAPSPVKLLNHPLRAMRRYELLRELKERSLNDFDVYRLTERRRLARFPVFIRTENEHLGPETGLLNSPAELEAAIESLRDQGKCPDARLAVEYCAEPLADGLYRKYGVFYVDGDVIPRHVLFARGWLVKGKTKVINDAVVEEERTFLETNPHASHVKEIFRMARIDYGRIDYALVNGKVQTYEINVNPTVINAGPLERTRKKVGFTEAIGRAYARLETGSPEGAGPRPRTFSIATPLRGWRARMASRVCQRILGRQLRTPI